MKIYIYDIEKLELVGTPFITSTEDFADNPTKFFPLWNDEIHVAKLQEIVHAVKDGDDIREKTREERILSGETYLLVDGEYLENGKIITVAVPTNLFIPAWKDNKWVESATSEQFDDEIDKLIDEYIELDKKKTARNSLGFNSTKIEEQMAENIIRREELLEMKENL
jgi:hypothetical protein